MKKWKEYAFYALMVIGLSIGLSALFTPSNWDKQHKLCDKSVDALLHSHDLVEVVRGGFIVIQLECSISNRLGNEP